MPISFHKAYWICLVATIAVAAGYAYQRDLYGLFLHCQDNEQQVRALEDDLEALEQREADLRERVSGLDTDPVEMEAAIRHNRKLVREGEKVYRVQLEPDSMESTECVDLPESPSAAQQGAQPEPDTRNPST